MTVKCARCEGEGLVETSKSFGDTYNVDTCPDCHGSGRAQVGEDRIQPKDGEYAHPRPWLRFQHDKHDFSLLSFGGEIAHVWAEEADFDFIFRAVNAADARDDLLTVARGALGYLEALPAQYRPDEAWFAPLRATIKSAEGKTK